MRARLRRDSRGASEQSQRHRCRSSARKIDRRHRPERLRQVLARVRDDLRRRPAPLRRDIFALHAAIPRSHGQTARRRHSRNPAGYRDRAIESGEDVALDRRHDDRDQRLLEIALAAHRESVLPELRPRDPTGNRKIDRRSSVARLRRQNCSDHVLGCSSRRKPSRKKFFEFLQQQGYLRVWIDNEVVRVDVDSKKIKRLGARVQVIQDRIAISARKSRAPGRSDRDRAAFGKGKVNIIPIDSASQPSSLSPHPFSTGWHCAHCDLDIRPPTPGLFSFNNPLGACPECRGFGRTIAIDLNKAIPDRSLSIKQGVVRVFRGQEFGESQKDLLRACAREEIDIDVPFEELPKADQDFVIKARSRSHCARTRRELHRRRLRKRSLVRRARIFPLGRTQDLQDAHARSAQPVSRLHDLSELQRRPFPARSAELQTRPRSAIRDPRAFSLFPISLLFRSRTRAIFSRRSTSQHNDSTAEMLRDEICARLNYLCEVGVGYLTLDRSTRTLSGGEVQRVNLTTCLGASLVNTLFVMDEPSIGLASARRRPARARDAQFARQGQYAARGRARRTNHSRGRQLDRHRARPRRTRRRIGFQRSARSTFVPATNR